jgi:hypothetical protein
VHEPRLARELAVGEEGCPMPEGTWHFRPDKRSGPAGDVIVRFRVG